MAGYRLGSMDDGGPVAVLTGLRGRRRGNLRAWGGAKASTVEGCVRLFIERQKCKVASAHSDGTTFYSYNQPIARWKGDLLEMDCRKFSVTTSKHQRYLKRYAPSNAVCREFDDRRSW